MSLKEVLDCVDIEKCNMEECTAIYSLANSLAKFQMSGLKSLTKPDDVEAYLRYTYMGLHHEIFGVIFLDSQNRILFLDELFRGTIDETSVHPREVAKLALNHNAAACIFFHNHPSGTTEPSSADRKMTERLKELLSLFSIKVLDHFVVGKEGSVSFAERGLI